MNGSTAMRAQARQKNALIWNRLPVGGRLFFS